MSKRVWVEIETNKGAVHVFEGVQFTCSYRGRIDEHEFNAILEAPESKRFVRLDDVYWIDHDEWVNGELVIWPVRYGRDYLYKHLRGAKYLRVCDIVAMAPIDGDEDREWMDAAAKARDEEREAEKRQAQGDKCSPLPDDHPLNQPRLTREIAPDEAYANCKVCDAPILPGDTTVCIERTVESRDCEDVIRPDYSLALAYLCEACGRRFPAEATRVLFGGASRED